MMDPARASVDDGADLRDPAVPDGPSRSDYAGLQPGAVILNEYAPPAWLAELFPQGPVPAEDRIF